MGRGGVTSIPVVGPRVNNIYVADRVAAFIKMLHRSLFSKSKKGDLLKAIWARYFRTTTTITLLPSFKQIFAKRNEEE